MQIVHFKCWWLWSYPSSIIHYVHITIIKGAPSHTPNRMEKYLIAALAHHFELIGVGCLWMLGFE
jgi:hypothetical protein